MFRVELALIDCLHLFECKRESAASNLCSCCFNCLISMSKHPSRISRDECQRPAEQMFKKGKKKKNPINNQAKIILHLQ